MIIRYMQAAAASRVPRAYVEARTAYVNKVWVRNVTTYTLTPVLLASLVHTRLSLSLSSLHPGVKCNGRAVVALSAVQQCISTPTRV